MLNLTRLHLGIAHESQFQGLGITGKDYKSFVFADTDGFWNGQVDGGDTLSFCYMHTNSKSTVVSCSQVKRTR